MMRLRKCGTNTRETAQGSEYVLKVQMFSVRNWIASFPHTSRKEKQALGDLCGKTYAEMMKVRNLGKRSLAEIEDKMKENGLRFRPEGEETHDND